MRALSLSFMHIKCSDREFANYFIIYGRVIHRKTENILLKLYRFHTCICSQTKDYTRLLEEKLTIYIEAAALCLVPDCFFTPKTIHNY